MNLFELETASTVSGKSVLNASFHSSDNVDILPKPSSPIKISQFIKNKKKENHLSLREYQHFKLEKDDNEEKIIEDHKNSNIIKNSALKISSNADLEIIRNNENLSETFFTSRNSVCIQAPLMASTPFNPPNSAALSNISTKHKRNLFDEKSELPHKDARISWANELLMFITMHLDLEGIDQDVEKQKLLKVLITQFKNSENLHKSVLQKLNQHTNDPNKLSRNIDSLHKNDSNTDKNKTIQEQTLIPSSHDTTSNIKKGVADEVRGDVCEENTSNVDDISSYEDDTDICEDLQFLNNDSDHDKNSNIHSQKQATNENFKNNSNKFCNSLSKDLLQSKSQASVNDHSKFINDKHHKTLENCSEVKGDVKMSGVCESMTGNNGNCRCIHNGSDNEVFEKKKITSNRVASSVSSEVDSMEMVGEVAGDNSVFLNDFVENKNKDVLSTNSKIGKTPLENHGICLTINKAYSSSKELNEVRSAMSSSRESPSTQSGQLILGVVDDVVLDGCDDDDGVVNDVCDHAQQMVEMHTNCIDANFSDESSRQSLHQLLSNNNQHLNNNNSHKQQNNVDNSHYVESSRNSFKHNTKPTTKVTLEWFDAGTGSESGTWNFHGFKSELDSQTSASLKDECHVICDDVDAHQPHLIPYKIPDVEEILYKRCATGGGGGGVSKPTHHGGDVRIKHEQINVKRDSDNISKDDTLVSVEDGFDKTISSSSADRLENKGNTGPCRVDVVRNSEHNQSLYIDFSAGKSLRDVRNDVNDKGRIKTCEFKASVGSNDKNMLGGSLRELEKVNGERFISDDLLHKWRGIMDGFKKRREEDRKMMMMLNDASLKTSSHQSTSKHHTFNKNCVTNKESVQEKIVNKENSIKNKMADKPKDFKNEGRKLRESQSVNMPQKKRHVGSHKFKTQNVLIFNEKKKMGNVASSTADNSKLSEHYRAYLAMLATKNPPPLQHDNRHSSQHHNNKNNKNKNNNNNNKNNNNNICARPYDGSMKLHNPEEDPSRCGIFKWTAPTRNATGGGMGDLQVVHPGQPSLQQQLIKNRPDFFIRATNRRNKMSHMMERRRKKMSEEQERMVGVVMRCC